MDPNTKAMIDRISKIASKTAEDEWNQYQSNKAPADNIMSYAEKIPYVGAIFGKLYDHFSSLGGKNLKEENNAANKQRLIDSMVAFMNYGMSPPAAQVMTDLSVDYTMKGVGDILIDTLNGYVAHFTPEELEASQFIGSSLLALGDDPKVTGLMLAYKGGPPGFGDIGELDDAGHVPNDQQSPLPFYLAGLVAAKALDGDIDKTVEATLASAIGFKDALFANTDGVPDADLYPICTTRHYKPGFLEAGKETTTTTCTYPPWDAHRFGQACIAAIAAAKANKPAMIMKRGFGLASQNNIGSQRAIQQLATTSNTSKPNLAHPGQAAAAPAPSGSGGKIAAAVVVAGLAAGAYWIWRKKHHKPGRK